MDGPLTGQASEATGKAIQQSVVQCHQLNRKVTGQWTNSYPVCCPACVDRKTLETRTEMPSWRRTKALLTIKNRIETIVLHQLIQIYKHQTQHKSIVIMFETKKYACI